MPSQLFQVAQPVLRRQSAQFTGDCRDRGFTRAKLHCDGVQSSTSIPRLLMKAPAPDHQRGLLRARCRVYVRLAIE